MKKPLFTGVCTALVTPFFEGKINFPLVKQLLRAQMEAGVEAVVLSGTTGEAPTLTDEEKLQLFKISKEFVGDRCKIIAGTGSNSTDHAIKLSIAAQKVGVDGLLVVSPYYNKSTPDGLYAHYMSIGRAVDIPIIVYNVPTRTGVDIPVSVYKKLSNMPNIIGVKEASADLTKQARIHHACGDDFHVWAGNDDQIVPSMAFGGVGVISVVSNLFPLETVAMTNAALSGDFELAAALQVEMMPLIDLLFCEVNPIPVKYAMGHIGFDCGGCRLPLTQLSTENKKKIDAFFQ